jgi:hypothetical protein
MEGYNKSKASKPKRKSSSQKLFTQPTNPSQLSDLESPSTNPEDFLDSESNDLDSLLKSRAFNLPGQEIFNEILKNNEKEGRGYNNGEDSSEVSEDLSLDEYFRYFKLENDSFERNHRPKHPDMAGFIEILENSESLDSLFEPNSNSLSQSFSFDSISFLQMKKISNSEILALVDIIEIFKIMQKDGKVSLEEITIAMKEKDFSENFKQISSIFNSELKGFMSFQEFYEFCTSK